MQTTSRRRQRDCTVLMCPMQETPTSQRKEERLRVLSTENLTQMERYHTEKSMTSLFNWRTL